MTALPPPSPFFRFLPAAPPRGSHHPRSSLASPHTGSFVSRSFSSASANFICIHKIHFHRFYFLYRFFLHTHMPTTKSSQAHKVTHTHTHTLARRHKHNSPEDDNSASLPSSCPPVLIRVFPTACSCRDMSLSLARSLTHTSPSSSRRDTSHALERAPARRCSCFVGSLSFLPSVTVQPLPARLCLCASPLQASVCRNWPGVTSAPFMMTPALPARGRYDSRVILV